MGRKIIVASDSFKGSLSSLQVGEAAAKGVKNVMPDCHVEVVPVADGGEGTVDAIISALKGRYIRTDVIGPLGEPVSAVYGICGEIAVIEMAAASGLPLVPVEKRNPWITTSYGTGELIRDAVSKGCREFLIGIGGSATNDGGVGMLQALGYRFIDETGEDIGFGGGELRRIVKIDSSDVLPELKDCKFSVACDVTNPLIGKNGTSHIFGAQKGADAEMIKDLDYSLMTFARVVAVKFEEDFSAYPGAGAAGGLGFAFLVFLRANLMSGIDMVLDTIGFDDKLENAAIVITGEGRLDSQTCMGKAPYGVLQRAKRRNIPVVAICGAVESKALPVLIEAGFNSVFPIVGSPMPLSEALNSEVAAENVERTVSQIFRVLMLKL